MDAVMYLKEKARMIGANKKQSCNGLCTECPLKKGNDGTKANCTEVEIVYPEKAVEIVEKWSNEHPRKTYLMDFLEKYPNAELNEDGIPKSCAEYLGYKVSCRDCKECWNTHMED